MKTKIFTTQAVAGVVAISMATALASQPPKMKMSTPIPPGVGTPDKVETRLGTLTSFDGVPDAGTYRVHFYIAATDKQVSI